MKLKGTGIIVILVLIAIFASGSFVVFIANLNEKNLDGVIISALLTLGFIFVFVKLIGKLIKIEAKEIDKPLKKRNFYPLNYVGNPYVDGYIRILNDCNSLVTTTMNIETLVIRMNTGAQKVKQFQCNMKKITRKPVDISYYYNLFITERNEVLKKGIKRCFEKHKLECMILKTDKAKENRKIKFFSNLTEFYKDFDDDLILFCEALKTKEYTADDPYYLPSNIFEITTVNSTLDLNNMALPNSEISNHFSLSEQHISKDVFRLLWFYDGEFKNLSDTDDEPSGIITSLPISDGIAEKMDYYPSYRTISPKQRMAYLKWLQNITSPIDIGYVFLFYYGLERHLIYGDYKEAAEMTVLLQSIHQNNSFLAYSSDALLISAALHNDYSTIQKMNIENLSIEVKATIIAMTHRKYEPEQIISFAKTVGFTNNRYIKNEYSLFLHILTTEINGIFYIKDEYFEKCQLIHLALANYKLQQRFAGFPSILTNETLRNELYEILRNTHEKVKNELKKLRGKKG